VGYLAEEADFYPQLNALQHLAFVGDVFGLAKDERNHRIDELLALFSLEDAARRPVKKYSFGMKRKLGMAMALLSSPRFLILDEPFNGLDPVVRRDLRAGVRRMCDAQGMTVLMATHNLGLADQYADRLLLLAEGNQLWTGTHEELRKQHPGKTIEEFFLNQIDPGAGAVK